MSASLGSGAEIQKIQIYRIWNRNWVIFRRTWLISVFWVILEPVFILTALGFGLGAYVQTIGGLPYAEFFFPGLLCSSTMMISYFESTYSNFAKLSYSKVYSAQMLSPVTIPEIVMGDLAWGATKGMFSAVGILMIGALFGLGQTWGTIPGFAVLFLNAWIFSCVGMIVTSYVRNYDQIIYPTSGLIVPMSLFAGTYFPIENLNPILRGISYLMPLTHTTQLVRALALGKFEPYLLIHLVVLLILAVVLARVAIRRMVHRLQL